MSAPVTYRFCVVEAGARDRSRAVSLVAKLLAAGFALQSSDYSFHLVPFAGAANAHLQPMHRDVAIYTLVRQPAATQDGTSGADAAQAQPESDQAALDAHIADATQSAGHLSVQIA